MSLAFHVWVKHHFLWSNDTYFSLYDYLILDFMAISFSFAFLSWLENEFHKASEIDHVYWYIPTFQVEMINDGHSTNDESTIQGKNNKSTISVLDKLMALQR